MLRNSFQIDGTYTNTQAHMCTIRIEPVSIYVIGTKRV